MKDEIECKAVFNLFKMHYEDAEYFLSIAEEHKKQNKRELELRYSRSAILSYFYSLEALINFILFHMHSKKISSTPTLENLEKMRIYDKYLLAPLICVKLAGEALDSKDFESLNELSCLRNDYVHSKYISTRRRIPTTEIDVVANTIRTSEGLEEVLVDIRPKEEKYKLAGLNKNIFCLDYADALQAKKIADRLFEKMNNMLRGELLGRGELPGVSEDELLAEKAGLLSPWIDIDLFVDVPEKDFKKLDDTRLKDIITIFIEEKLSGDIKKRVDSLSPRQKEQLTAELVKAYKLRRRFR